MHRYEEVDIADRLDLTTSKGCQTKWYANGFWIKADTLGCEGLAEELVSQFARCISNINCIDYYSVLVGPRRVTGCACESFASYPEVNISFATLLRGQQPLPKNAPVEERIQRVINVIKEKCRLDVTGYLAQALYLDALTLNEDRHFCNLSVLYNVVTDEYTVAPIFDNGAALCSNLPAYDGLLLSERLHAVHSKPFSLHFDRQVKAMQSITDFKLKVYYNTALDLLSTYTNELYDSKFVENATSLLRNRLTFWEDKLWTRL